MADVSLRKVSKAYGPVRVIPGLDLEIAHGEFLVLVGPSGCGKSTLLRMLAGLETVTGGDMVVAGKRINDLPARERNVSMVFQSYALFPHLKVDRNMSFGLEIRKTPRAMIAEKVKAAAASLNLSPYLDRFPKQLSGGQRQRVAMGRAIVREPSIFLFDEPLSNLDAKLRVSMRAEIKDLHRRLKNTIVYVTHDQIEAMTMADRIVVMREGEIEQVGTPLELYDHPRTAFVAGFLGAPSMNFLTGTRRNGRIEIAGLGQIPDPDPKGAGEVRLGIRPEHMTLGTGEMRATVWLVEPTGADTLVHLRQGDVALTVVSKERRHVAPGEEMAFSFDPAQVHFFDPKGGGRVV
jgi:multiple sugar transport system ATP-binding protein